MAPGARPSVPFLLAVAGLALLGLLAAPDAEANRRGGTVSWEAVDADTVEVTGGLAVSTATGPSFALGSVTCTLALGGEHDACMLVTEIGQDASASGVIVGSDGGPLRIHFPGAASPQALGFDECCWLGPGLSGQPTHHNNPYGAFVVPSTVTFGAGSPPRFEWVPVRGCPASTTCSFPLHATDPDGDPITYALATTEAGAGFAQPPGVAVDPATGQVTWSAPADPDATRYDAWSVAVTATDGTHTTVTEFLLELEAPACGWAVPPEVAGLTATPAGSDPPSVHLSWTPGTGGACPVTGVVVERSTLGHPGSFGLVTTLPPGTTSFTDTAVPNCGTYWYRVREVSASGGFARTSVQVGVAYGSPPAAPTLSATHFTAPFLYGWLEWTPAPADPLACPTTHYDLYRSHGGGAPVLVARIGAGGRSHVDDGVRACADSTYTVHAVSMAGTSAPGTALLQVGEVPQAEPADLHAFSMPSSVSLTQAWLQWEAPADNGCGYGGIEVWRNGALVATVPAGPGYGGHLDDGRLPCVEAQYTLRSRTLAGTAGGFSAPLTHRHDPTGACLVGVPPPTLP